MLSLKLSLWPTNRPQLTASLPLHTFLPFAISLPNVLGHVIVMQPIFCIGEAYSPTRDKLDDSISPWDLVVQNLLCHDTSPWATLHIVQVASAIPSSNEVLPCLNAQFHLSPTDRVILRLFLRPRIRLANAPLQFPLLWLIRHRKQIQQTCS